LRVLLPISRFILPLLLPVLVRAQTGAGWTAAGNSHFRVYSQAGESSARSTLQVFEQLRAFFQRTGFAPDNGTPVRVIEFRSQRDYEQYRLRPAADAYYVGDGSSNCIVAPSPATYAAGIAAHEYAHLVLHANALQFPPWLNEGLAEYFSTLQISQRSTKLGGDLPMRSQLLKHSPWMPLSRLFTVTTPDSRAEASLFYAQSWALAEMLILSPEYRPRFPDFLAKLSTETAGADALTAVYGKSPEAMASDAHRWIEGERIPAIVLPPITIDNAPVLVSKLSLFESRCLMAQLLFDIGDTNRAEAAYQALQRESPDHAEVEAALGNIALRRGDRGSARRYWELAMRHGISDANLCYRYALLAGDMGLPDREVSAALERAVTLRPEFDDARYKLALMQNNGGNYAAALAQLTAMKQVGTARAFAYWSAIAYAHSELGEREPAKVAATKAIQYATTQAERDRAAELLYFAETDLTVQATHDANGNTRFVTTRVKHGSEHLNPFIEPQDHMVRVHAQLTRVDCANNAMTAVGVDTGKASLTLVIADPGHVLTRNAPPEFTCGPQSPVAVIVEYAAKSGVERDGLLRGIEFEKAQTDLK